jgi:hypothetical protein
LYIEPSFEESICFRQICGYIIPDPASFVSAGSAFNVIDITEPSHTKEILVKGFLSFQLLFMFFAAVVSGPHFVSFLPHFLRVSILLPSVP